MYKKREIKPKIHFFNKIINDALTLNVPKDDFAFGHFTFILIRFLSN